MAETSTIFGFMKYVSATDILSDFKKTVDSHFVNSLNVQIYIGRYIRGTTKIPSAYTDDASFLTRIHDLASNLRPNNSKTRSKSFPNNLHLPLSLLRKITFVLLLFFVYVNYYIRFLKTCKMKMKLFYIFLQKK